jgi:hypothetical protein
VVVEGSQDVQFLFWNNTRGHIVIENANYTNHTFTMVTNKHLAQVDFLWFLLFLGGIAFFGALVKSRGFGRLVSFLLVAAYFCYSFPLRGIKLTPFRVIETSLATYCQVIEEPKMYVEFTIYGVSTLAHFVPVNDWIRLQCSFELLKMIKLNPQSLKDYTKTLSDRKPSNLGVLHRADSYRFFEHNGLESVISKETKDGCIDKAAGGGH